MITFMNERKVANDREIVNWQVQQLHMKIIDKLLIVSLFATIVWLCLVVG